MKSLQAGWREALCEEPERVAGRMGSLHLGADADWAEREFGRGTHPDGRVRRRIEEMGRCWEKRPGMPLPEIFPDRASQEAAYRLLSNERVAVDDILEGHRETTVERCQHAGVVLMVQDTTMLNYDNLRDATSGLAALGGGGKGTVGVPVHATLAVAQGGRPLGVCALEGDFRESVEAKAAREPGVAQEPESARWLRSLEQAAAVGHACSNIRVISVADRRESCDRATWRVMVVGGGRHGTEDEELLLALDHVLKLSRMAWHRTPGSIRLPGSRERTAK